MLARERERLEALRGIKAALQIEKTKKGATVNELPDEISIMVLKRLHKQRKESAEIYAAQNRQDLADVETFQASVIETFLPAQMSEDQIRQVIGQAIKESGAASAKDMGMVMGIVTKKLAGKADNKIVAGMVREMLES